MKEWTFIRGIQTNTNKTTTTTKLPHRNLTFSQSQIHTVHTCKTVHVADDAWAVSARTPNYINWHSHLYTPAVLSISGHHAAPLGGQREIKLINRSDLGLVKPKDRACMHASTTECKDYLIPFGLTPLLIVQELCESRSGRPGLSVLTNLLVSVDVKLRHWSQLVPNMSTDIWGH